MRVGLEEDACRLSRKTGWFRSGFKQNLNIFAEYVRGGLFPLQSRLEKYLYVY